MPSHRGKQKRGRSILSGLPDSLKRALHAQPRLESAAAAAAVKGAHPTGLLPTQPPDDDGMVSDATSCSGMDMEMDSGDDSDKENVRPAPQRTPTYDAELARGGNGDGTNAVVRRRRFEPVDAAQDLAAHPWDCTGLVPRYTEKSQVPRHLVKYWYQRARLFPHMDSLPLLLDDTGWYSVTPAAIATHIAERCRCDVILDAFCGLGGNAIAFARTCERVIAMDIDLTRLRLARHNALHYGVADRIEFVHCDYIEWARRYKEGREEVDVVFLSPPWGGPAYTKEQVFALSAIEPIPGDELFTLTSRVSPNIAYYLPRNLDVPAVAALAEPLDKPENDAVDGVRTREREWVEIEEEWVGDKVKAVTAYYGALVAGA